VQIGPRLSLEKHKGAELFLNLVEERLLGSNEPDYRRAVREVLLSLASSIGKSLGVKGWPLIERRPVGVLDCGDITADDLPGLYQLSLSVSPRVVDGEVEWRADNAVRRSAGSYFTPLAFVDRLLSWALDGHGETVCDPSCGAGAFLIRAFEHSRDERLLFGCDNDPVAVMLCRLMFWLKTERCLPETNLLCADALTLDWRGAFRSVFGAGGFDAVVGNPPFGGVVDGRVPEDIKALRNSRFPELGGTADYSFYFASLALQIVKKDGRVALVLPRAFLSAMSSSRLRSSFEVIQSGDRHDTFQDAAVYVCLVGSRARLSLADVDAVDATPQALSVSASLTVSEAYDLISTVVDSKLGNAPKLLTTGLIDCEKSLWGEVPCRFLKSTYLHPRARGLKPSRLSAARKPKLLVAGLSRTIECYFDEAAECAGSVGTYTITHALDDRAELRRAMDRLHSREVSERFRRELGAAALGGGSITLTKRFLRQVLAEEGF